MGTYRELLAAGVASIVQAAESKGMVSRPVVASVPVVRVPVVRVPAAVSPVTGKKVRALYKGGKSRFALRELAPKTGTIRADGYRCIGQQRFVDQEGRVYWRAQFTSPEAYKRRLKAESVRSLARYHRLKKEQVSREGAKVLRTANEKKGGREA